MARPAPFRIPREITIRGKRWLVALDSELGDDKHDARSRINLRTHTLGMTFREHNDSIRREIHLSTRHASDRALAQTFLHELLHACAPVDDALPAEQEEKFILSVEAPLLRALEQLDWTKR